MRSPFRCQGEVAAVPYFFASMGLLLGKYLLLALKVRVLAHFARQAEMAATTEAMWKAY